MPPRSPSAYRDESPEPFKPPEALEPLRYACVKAVMLYWEDSNSLRDHAMEAKKMEVVFRCLGYETEIHIIPVVDSHDDVLELIKRQQQSLSLYARYPRGSCLLIIHYSGYGDSGTGYDEAEPHTFSLQRMVWRQ